MDESLNYIERPVAVLDRKFRILHNKEMKLVKVQWPHGRRSEWTWEPYDEMQEHYSNLFTSSNFEDEVYFN